MLTEMRALSQNWFGRAIMGLVLGLIILSFAVWGIGDRFTNFNAGELARVGSTRITVDQYRTAYQTDLQRLQQRQKRAITNDEAKRLGIDRQVLSRLLTDTILDQQAAKLGLAVGDAEIVQSIMKDPTFKGPNEKFDQGVFDRLLRENGYTEASYAKTQRSQLLRQDISSAVIGQLDLPGAMTEAIHRFQTEVRDFDFFVLPPSAAGQISPPSDAALKSYYDEHAGAYVAPEYRKLVVLSVVPVDLVKPDAVSDADIERRYEDTKATRFTQPDKRTVEQLVFADAKAAEAAMEKLKGGATFAKLVTDEHKSPADIDLGTVAKSDLADPAVGEAAFALPENGTSGPVKGQFGTVLVHVTKIVSGRQQPLQEVRAELKDELAIGKAKQQAAKMRDAVEDQRTAGKTLTEAAASVGLKPRTIEAIDAQGRDKARKPVEGLAAGPQLLRTAFATDIGADTEMISIGDGGNAWFEVAGIDPSHQLALAEVKPRVEAGWRNDEIGRRLAAAGDKLVKEIDDGKALSAVAAENGKLAVQKAVAIGRGGGPQLPQLVAAAFFDTVVGRAGSVTDGAEGRIIFKIEAAHVPPLDPKKPDFAKLLDQVRTGFEDDTLAQYLAKVQGDVGVSINQQALQTALGDSGGS